MKNVEQTGRKEYATEKKYRIAYIDGDIVSASVRTFPVTTFGFLEGRCRRASGNVRHLPSEHVQQGDQSGRYSEKLSPR